MMTNRVLPLIVLLFSTMVACRGEAAQPAAGADDDATYYEMTIAPVATAVGTRDALVVVVVPKTGFKVNLEFPTSLAVAAADTDLVTFEKTRIRRGDAEIEASTARATLSLPFTAKKAGTGQLEAKVSFSVCTDKACHIFRNRAVQAAITVQ